MAETLTESGWTKVLCKHHPRTTITNNDTLDMDMTDNNTNQLTPGTQTETQKNTNSNRTEKTQTTNGTKTKQKPIITPAKLHMMDMQYENRNKRYKSISKARIQFWKLTENGNLSWRNSKSLTWE